MNIAGNWDWQEGCVHGTPLAETPRAGAEPWPPRRATSVEIVVLGNQRVSCPRGEHSAKACKVDSSHHAVVRSNITESVMKLIEIPKLSEHSLVLRDRI